MEKQFFETKVRGMATNERDEQKLMDVNYLVKAQDFSGAETLSLEDANISMEEVRARAIKLSNVYEVIDDSQKDKYYKVRVNLIMFDMDANRETKTKAIYLVAANSAVEADDIIHDHLRGDGDFEVCDINETKIFSVLENISTPKEGAE